jgi:hypothetical protein
MEIKIIILTTFISVFTMSALVQKINAQNIDVYVVGYVEKSDGNMEGKVWKNGKATNLYRTWKEGLVKRIPGEKKYAFNKHIFVDRDDVYIVNHEENSDGDNVAYVVKNDKKTYLTDGKNDAVANSVFIVGNDVYVAGEEDEIAVVWKNGVATKLTPDCEDCASSANFVFVIDNDVYVAGTDESEDEIAVVWKNGVATNLTDMKKSAGNANSVFVVGNDVYVAGTELLSAVVWKNGVATKLSKKMSEAHSVFVNGKDVYVAGTEDDAAIVWKNGVSTKLTNGKHSASARYVFVVKRE